METQTTPELIPTTVVELSEKTKVTAHPGDKWKAGYVTLSRSAQNKTGWRNVHISKKSFEKFVEHLPSLDEAIREKSSQYQLMLTRKQHVLTTRFQREGKESLHYVSFMHPTEERDSLNGAEEVNHAKTVNLTESEFTNLKNEAENLLKVVRSKNAVSENEESATIDGFRWLFRQTGERSAKICLNERECAQDARQHFQGLPSSPQTSNYENLYDYVPVRLQRPSKLEVIENIAYLMIVENLRDMDESMSEDEPPIPDNIRVAALCLDTTMLYALTKKILNQLKYKQLYMTSELVQIFLYVDGLIRVKSLLLKHIQPGGGKLYSRLLQHCFLTAIDELKKD